MFYTKPIMLLLFILCIISFTGAAHSTTLDTHDIAIDSRGNIFIGTEGEGVYRSIDNGETIEQAGLEGLDVEVIAVNSGDYIFAGTEGQGIYRSTDGGDTWTAVNNGLPEICGVWSIAFVSEEIIVAGATEGAFLSYDGGESWTNIGFTDIMIREVVITPEGDIIAVAQHDGIYRTGDFGDTSRIFIVIGSPVTKPLTPSSCESSPHTVIARFCSSQTPEPQHSPRGEKTPISSPISIGIPFIAGGFSVRRIRVALFPVFETSGMKWCIKGV